MSLSDAPFASQCWDQQSQILTIHSHRQESVMGLRKKRRRKRPKKKDARESDRLVVVDDTNQSRRTSAGLCRIRHVCLYRMPHSHPNVGIISRRYLRYILIVRNPLWDFEKKRRRKRPKKGREGIRLFGCLVVWIPRIVRIVRIVRIYKRFGCVHILSDA
jgi:hypothetical protein